MKLDLKAIEERCEKAIPGYHVTKDGQVVSVSHNWRGYGARPLKQHPNSHGYLRVRLTIEGKRKSFFVHKLVTEIFHGPKPGKEYQVCHKDGARTNNSVDNLRWGTAKENAADRTKHGRCKAAENGRKSAYKLMGKRK